jgi:hypothetical protein
MKLPSNINKGSKKTVIKDRKRTILKEIHRTLNFIGMLLKSQVIVLQGNG